MTPITISKFKNEHRVSQGLRFQLSKLHKIDEHLYSFCITHMGCKYLTEITPIGCYHDGVGWYELQMSDAQGKDEVTAEDIQKGNVLGGSIKIKLSKKVDDILLRFVPLKWETMVFVILDFKGEESLWEIER